MTHPTAVANCLMRELGVSNRRKEQLFPLLPHDSYGVILDLHPASFDTAAR
jgi:hypothetical protein